MTPQTDLMHQINELQEAVVAMKVSFGEAVTKLSLMEETSSGAEIEEMKRKCEGNSAEILKMVLGLKTDFSSLRHEVMTISKRQDTLHKSFRLMLEDRKSLASDLSQAGVISHQTKSRLDNFSGILTPIGTGAQSGSGSHSNDSGVALLLEKTHSAFAEDAGGLPLVGQRASDQDSLPDQPSLLVPASVYDYVAGLSQQNASLSSSNTAASSQFFCQDSLPPAASEQPSHTKEGSDGRCDVDDVPVVYDSDSSLTIAANKTISLSTCISQGIKVNDAYTTMHTSPSEGGSNQRRSRDSEGPNTSKERASSQSRRRRPLLGVSSTKMYQSSSHCYPSGEKEHYAKYRYVSKSDQREAHRYKLAKELVDTEKQYCRTLWTIQDVFAEPLKKATILSNKDISTLFPDEVYQLYDKHCLLQHQLKERLASWKWQPLIGDILARFTDPHHCEVLRLYTSYVNDFPEILKTFHKLCHTSQPFTEFIKNCLDQPTCRGLDLGAFLLTPVQRVPKYILLLKQLIKYTDSTHPDYRFIDTVLERLRDFLSRLNDAMEHSFHLVNSSLSPSMNSAAGLTVSSIPSKHRGSRNPRKSTHSRGSPSSYSPSTRRNRSSRIYEESISPSEEYRSPKRSCSSAGGASSPRKSSSSYAAAGRSASLPRGFPSLSSDSSGEGQESSPERKNRTKNEGTACYHSHESTPYHPRNKYTTLAPARSATNVMTGDDGKTRWDDLAASEPSLIDPKLPANKGLSKKSPSLSSSHNIHMAPTTVSTANTHKLVTWTDSVESTEDSKGKKKTSIKSSIKNMFTFKKRTNCPRNGRDEPLYWPSSVIMETSAETSPTHIYGSTVSGQNTTTSSMQTNSTVGDFVDEEGNPCTNV